MYTLILNGQNKYEIYERSIETLKYRKWSSSAYSFRLAYSWRHYSSSPSMAGQSSSRGSLPLTRFKSSKIAAVVIITFIIVLCLLVTLLPLDFTSNIIAPYIDKASDLWHGGVVRQGREAARGALAEVGLKQSFRSRRCVRLKLKLKR